MTMIPWLMKKVTNLVLIRLAPAPKAKRKMTEIEWDGAGASDEKNPAKVAKEMEKGFERAEEKEMEDYRKRNAEE